MSLLSVDEVGAQISTFSSKEKHNRQNGYQVNPNASGLPANNRKK
jgi:hypothetical protein